MRDVSILDEASSAFADLLNVKHEMHEIEERLGDASVSTDDHDAMLERYSALQDRFRIEEGYSIDLKVATVLRGLGFTDETFEQPDRLALGRVADAARAREAAARPADAPAARRADQPPRSRGAELARGISLGISARCDSGLARSLLPRRGRHAHHRSQSPQAHGLSRQLLALHRRARRADGAAAQSRSASRTKRSRA